MTEVLTTVDGAIATVTLNRPEALNAMNDPLLDQLIDSLETLDDDPGIRVIVVAGAGRAFCVGGDLAAEHEPMGAAQAETHLRRHVRAAEILRNGKAVSIAAVGGPAAGAGFALAAACDLRFAAEAAVFRSAFLTAAMSGDFGLAWSLSRLIGSARATEILVLNRRVDARRAVEIGLATSLHPTGDLMDAVYAVAAELAAGPPLAIAGILANLQDAANLSFTECLRREAGRHIASAFSADAAEAGRAFLQKRRPQFEGR